MVRMSGLNMASEGPVAGNVIGKQRLRVKCCSGLRGMPSWPLLYTLRYSSAQIQIQQSVELRRL